MAHSSPKTMRIRCLGRSEVDPIAGGIFDDYARVHGYVPRLFGILAHRPENLKTIVAHLGAVMNIGRVAASLKELVSLRVSQINGCEA